MNTKQFDGHAILSRYQRAEAIEHESFSNSTHLSSEVIPHWIDDGDSFWYARINKNETEYRRVDINTTSNIAAFDHEKLATKLTQATGETVISSSLPMSDVTFIGSCLTFDAFGKSWRFEDDNLKEVASSHPAHWLLSPDGKKAVFIKEHNLWLHELASGNERPLTTDGIQYHAYGIQPEGRDLIGDLGGQPEPEVAPEALWSPDGSKLFTVQLDELRVGTMPSIQYVPQDGSLRPRVTERKYALPGDKDIPEYRFLIIDVNTATHIKADYLPIEDSFIWLGVFSGNRAWWSGDGKKAYFLDMARGQKSVRVVEVLADSGETRVLFDECSDTYLEIGHNFEAPTVLIPMPSTDELIWFSQRDGFAHLYLYDLKSGVLKNPITTGNWSIRDAIYFDADRRDVFVQMMGRVEGRDFYYREIARFNVDSGEMTLLASSNHDYDLYNDYGGLGGLSPNGEYLVSTHARVNTMPVTDLRDRDGKVIMLLETGDDSALPEGWQWPEPIETLAADGETPIYGAIFRPSDFDPKKKYPILDFCHSNPFYAAAPKRAFSGYFNSAAAFAELGMIVVAMDGRGTIFRDKAFRDYGYDDFIENGGIVDRVAGIKQLAERYSYMDLSRVGIIDFDGSNAGAAGLLGFPEFYHVGVASSLYDPRLVKQGEVYMGLTTDEKRDQAVVWSNSINNFKGKLLIITGLRDKYYHPSATFQLTDELLIANKDFDHVVQTNGSHAWRVINSRRRMWDFLFNHLCGMNPPEGFQLMAGLEISWPDQITEKYFYGK